MQNTVILYDIENLIGGYGRKKLFDDISIARILAKLRQEGSHTVVMQKAYGSWGAGKVSKIKEEMKELGIKTVSVKHYGKTSAKNAADIRLVIDAMELLYTKPAIDTYIIVSGDGDFSALVSTLKAHGKQVISSAFNKNMSSYLKKISDGFISLDDTLDSKEIKKIEKKREKKAHQKKLMQNPMLGQSVASIKPIDSSSIADVLQQAVKVMRAFYDNPESRMVLHENGMNISVFKQAMDHAVKAFDVTQYGFERLPDFAAFVIQGTPLKLIVRGASEYRLIDETVQVEGFEDVEERRSHVNVHTLANYDAILSQKAPRLTLPQDMPLFYELCDYLIDRRENYVDMAYETMVKELQKMLVIGELETRSMLNLLITAGALEGDDPMSPVQNQYFTFTAYDTSEILTHIERTARKKIASFLGSVDDRLIRAYMNSFARP